MGDRAHTRGARRLWRAERHGPRGRRWDDLNLQPGRAAVIARGEDDNSFNLSWQLYVGPEGFLEAMLEASNEDNYCYPNNDCVPRGVCESDDMFVADGAWHHVALTRDAGGTLVFYVDAAE